MEVGIFTQASKQNIIDPAPLKKIFLLFLVFSSRLLRFSFKVTLKGVNRDGRK
jgi:hypothetical protein